MIRFIRALAFTSIALASFLTPCARADTVQEMEVLLPNPDATISLDMRDASLKDILKIFSIQSGVNFIANEAVEERTITLYFDKVPLKQAIDQLFKANNLSYSLDKGSNIILVKDWGKPGVETVTKIFYLKNATVTTSSLKEEQSSSKGGSGGGSEGSSSGGGGSSGSGGGGGKWTAEENSGLTAAVKKLLTPAGKLVEDYRTNSLVITDIPSQMEIISKTIAALDVPIPQIMLEVEMLDVAKNMIDKIGIKYMNTISASSFMFTAIMKGPLVSSDFPLSGLIGGKTVAKTFTPGSLDVANSNPYNIYLDFIRQQSSTRTLARPRVLTLNNEPAEIKITTSEAIGSITTTQGQGTASTTTTSAERVETGVSLRVTPQINLETGEITMFLLPRIREAVQSAAFPSFKDPEERSTMSLVKVRDGDTIILGGLIRNEMSKTTTKLPVLGDLPLVGALFRHKYKDKDRERELLVFITPHILKDSAVELATVKKINVPDREQGTISGFDRKDVISSSLNSFEKK